ncbi:acyl-CoA dehydrogenase family protein [Mycobacterium sp. 852013-50091_SCH5140682]|uniref:acyl-CoA dehydrogenase family protein n=1 Tax=Mycobacterium sp. 852013-50091_SCH5140682 TaxID=1834109 RepID=UPI000AD2858F|nr:acyl-CoA dehydrogenase family protein [Mycobacterium sp. 852013-50091_SCH5140682]
MGMTRVAEPASAATASDVGLHPLVGVVQRYADEVLRPSALQTDRHGIAPKRVAELAELGLLNHLAPEEFGGAAVDLASDRRIREILAGACLNTWLLWVQHAPLVQPLAKQHADGTTLSDRARDVVHGRLLVGAGLSDVRRYPDHYVAVERRTNEWVFSGTISWVTGWGLNQALAVAGVEPLTETVVTALIPVSGDTVAAELDLSAVGGSRTQRVTLNDVRVPDRDVISTESVAHWRRQDLGMSSDAQSHHFGLAYAVLDELDTEPDAQARAVSAGWRPRIDAIRQQSYALADEVLARDDGRHRVDERLAAKVAIGDALATLTRALVVARSGRGIRLDDTAQLHARSALFLLVQGQSAAVRTAQLEHLTPQENQ